MVPAWAYKLNGDPPHAEVATFATTSEPPPPPPPLFNAMHVHTKTSAILRKVWFALRTLCVRVRSLFAPTGGGVGRDAIEPEHASRVNDPNPKQIHVSIRGDRKPVSSGCDAQGPSASQPAANCANDPRGSITQRHATHPSRPKPTHLYPCRLNPELQTCGQFVCGVRQYPFLSCQAQTRDSLATEFRQWAYDGSATLGLRFMERPSPRGPLYTSLRVLLDNRGPALVDGVLCPTSERVAYLIACMAMNHAYAYHARNVLDRNTETNPLSGLFYSLAALRHAGEGYDLGHPEFAHNLYGAMLMGYCLWPNTPDIELCTSLDPDGAHYTFKLCVAVGCAGPAMSACPPVTVICGDVYGAFNAIARAMTHHCERYGITDENPCALHAVGLAFVHADAGGNTDHGEVDAWIPGSMFRDSPSVDLRDDSPGDDDVDDDLGDADPGDVNPGNVGPNYPGNGRS